MNVISVIVFTFALAVIKYQVFYIQIDPMLKQFTFIHVLTTFEYPIDRNYTMIIGHDTVLAVAVAPNLVVGPAAFRIRFITSREGLHVKNASLDGILKITGGETVEEVPHLSPNVTVTAFPNLTLYSSATMPNNIATIRFPKKAFARNRFPLISRTMFPKPGEWLTAVYRDQLKIYSHQVKVVNFSCCVDDFKDSINNAASLGLNPPWNESAPEASEKLFTDEQMCIKIVRSVRGIALPNTLLFSIKGNRVFYVANVSKNARKYAVATLVGKHCKFIGKNGRNYNICY